MEHIKSALKKAGVLDENQNLISQPASPSLGQTAPRKSSASVSAPVTLRKVEVNRKHLERKRIISKSMSDPTHIAFNLLRTRVRQTMSENNWKMLAITSPTPGCGKSMITLNLGFSLARAPGLKTVVVDLDLRRPSIAPTLDIEPTRSIAQFLQERAKPEDCFVELDANLIVGLNSGHTPASSELLQAPKMLDLFEFVRSLSPDIVLFDLPPMRSSDDALAFLPRIDSALLVVAAGTTTTQEVNECETQISELEKLMGVVLNKAADVGPEEYYY